MDSDGGARWLPCPYTGGWSAAFVPGSEGPGRAGPGGRLALGVHRGRWLLWGSWGRFLRTPVKREWPDEAPNVTRLTALHPDRFSTRCAALPAWPSKDWTVVRDSWP